jgi:hypothetical protein
LQIAFIAPLADHVPANPERGEQDEPKRKCIGGEEQQTAEQHREKSERDPDIAPFFE